LLLFFRKEESCLHNSVPSKTTGHPADRTRAAAILSIIEGSLLLEAARPGSTTTAQKFLARVLEIDAGSER